MKYAITILFSLGAFFSQATTYIVSNVPGFPANFSNLQTCVNAASNGDIVIVQGSGTSYGDIDVNKQLTILGPGYFLSQNPQTQAVLASAKLNSIYFKNGSGGSILEGMDIIGSRSLNYGVINNCWGNMIISFSIKIDSATINCISDYWDDAIQISNSNGSIINSCFGYKIWAYDNITDLHINNSIFISASIKNSSVNNSLYYYGFNGNSGYGNDCAENCVFKNNIISSSLSYFNNNGCSISNNIFIDNPLGINVGNNLVNIDPNSLFVGYPNQGAYSSDSKFRLKNGSPAIGAGEEGIDIGPFGGSSPYKLSGISLHPNIWFVNMPTIGTSGGGLQVQVKVNAND